MYIKNVEVCNFRLLQNISMTLDENSTVIVGRNNSGKTSLTEVFRRFFSVRPIFQLEDFSLTSLGCFEDALQAKLLGFDEFNIREKLPEIKLLLTIDYSSSLDSYGPLSDFIIDLDEKSIVAKLKVCYRLKDGKIDALFEGLSDNNQAELFKALKDRIPKLFSAELTAIDPTSPNNTVGMDYSKLRTLIEADFINAQRGLDDVTQSEKDVLGKVLSNIFKNSTIESAPPEMKKKADELEAVVDGIQGKVDTEFKEKVDALLPALRIFGYPGLSDSPLSTETTLNIQTILESNTKIRYQQDEGVSLPETYNGLGTRNLIYILFQLFEFFRMYQSSPVKVANHLIFIEEPEAHLHPQMQEVFIRQLNSIANEFSKTMNDSKPWPVMFVVSTHSTHIANEANFESIRYFLTKPEDESQACIKDLKAEFGKPERKIDKDFIHKYLTLTRCDMFFADKAMLIEGPTERLLMPVFIKKMDAENAGLKLGSQYVAVIEIGGAYAHHFYKFLDFLELKTLIITDIDSTEKTQTKKDKKIVYTACNVSKGTHSSNAGIKNWFTKEDSFVDLSTVRKAVESDKVEGTRRIAFQIPEKGTTACGRSFEDAFVLANRDLFKLSDIDEKNVEEAAYERAKNFKKTNFALKYALENIKWQVPLYIKEGLMWLADSSSENEKNIEEKLND